MSVDDNVLIRDNLFKELFKLNMHFFIIYIFHTIHRFSNILSKIDNRLIFIVYIAYLFIKIYHSSHLEFASCIKKRTIK